MKSIKDRLDAISNEQPTEDNLKYIIKDVVERPENFKIFSKGLDLELTACGEYETSAGRILQVAAEPNKTVGFKSSGEPIKLDNGYLVTISNLGVEKATAFIERLEHQNVLCSTNIEHTYQNGRDLSPDLSPETVLDTIKTVFGFE